jgi:hypothetical protein
MSRYELQAGLELLKERMMDELEHEVRKVRGVKAQTLEGAFGGICIWD